jgi:microcystin-dependent protein
MTDISKNWLDLSVNSNILKPTYINGFIDVSSNIVGRKNIWIKNEKDLGDTRLGLGTVDPSFMIDIMSDDPKIRLENTSINAATQNDSNLGTIDINCPSNHNVTTSSIKCKNINNDYDDNGSLIFSTGGGNQGNAEDKIVIDSTGNVGVGLLSPQTSGPSYSTQNNIRCVVYGNIACNSSLIGLGVTPLGGIVMWSGVISSNSPKINNIINYNWKICDGLTYNGIETPDLRNKFLVSIGDTYNMGDEGGANSVTLTINEMPGHNHSMNSAGNHGHTILVGRHRGGWDDDGTNHAIGTDNRVGGGRVYKSPNLAQEIDWKHTHSINSSGGSKGHENRPPYYALVYIMRVQ